MEYLRILPHLPVKDVAAEVAFYRKLGLTIFQQLKGFTSVQHGDGRLVHFGIKESAEPAPPPGFDWKLEVDDIVSATRLMNEQHISLVREPFQIPSGKWRIIVNTPNGYELTLESRLNSSVP